MRAYSAILALAVILAACLPPSLVDYLPGPGILVEAEWLSENIDNSSIVVVHVASSAEHYEEGHLPGAHFLHLESILDHNENELNVLPDVENVKAAFESVGVSDNLHVVLYGNMGGLAATRAFYTLDVFGHDRVSILDGGRDAWNALGLPLSTETPQFENGSFYPSLREHLVVNADWVEAHRNQNEYALLDARPREQYTGETPGRDISRPGRIPGAHNLFWQHTIRTGAVPTFLEEAEIASMLSDAGISDGQTIVAYCRTGIQASHAYFTARLLGQSVRMYDGSYYDWSNNTEYPVERD